MIDTVRYTLRKVCRFEAAHYIPHHKGPCRNPHGHSYRVEFIIRARELGPDGFVVDFGDLSALCRALDHQDLNTILPFPTTAENIAHYLAQKVFELHPHIEDIRVCVWETEGASVEVWLGRAS
jgi:6-pyruvoyltetrahydropterin/6-carboxytetrahydropterin synthase